MPSTSPVKSHSSPQTASVRALRLIVRTARPVAPTIVVLLPLAFALCGCPVGGSSGGGGGGGCADSPENPTVILGLLGAAVAALPIGGAGFRVDQSIGRGRPGKYRRWWSATFCAIRELRRQSGSEPVAALTAAEHRIARSVSVDALWLANGPFRDTRNQ